MEAKIQIILSYKGKPYHKKNETHLGFFQRKRGTVSGGSDHQLGNVEEEVPLVAGKEI